MIIFTAGLRRFYSLISTSYLLLITPSIPVIVIADRDRFQDRLLVTRHGGKFYLTQPVNPRQVVTVCQKAIQNSSQGKKIMISD